MAKNAPNELKFYQTCISMIFIKFQKIFGKFSKFADFWPKNHHLAHFSRRNFETFFSTEIVSGPWHGIKKSLRTRFWGASRAVFRAVKSGCVRDSSRCEKSS